MKNTPVVYYVSTVNSPCTGSIVHGSWDVSPSVLYLYPLGSSPIKELIENYTIFLCIIF